MAKTYLQSDLAYEHTKILLMVSTLLYHNMCQQGHIATATCGRNMPFIAAQLCCFVKLDREIRRHLPAGTWSQALQNTGYLILQLLSTTG